MGADGAKCGACSKALHMLDTAWSTPQWVYCSKKCALAGGMAW